MSHSAVRSPCASDTVATLPIRNRQEFRVINGVSVFPNDESQPYSTSPQWVLSANGAIVIVEVNPFQVTTRRKGSAPVTRVIKSQPVRLTSADKVAWREVKGAKAPAVVMYRDRRPADVAVMPSPFTEPKDWPNNLPPFADNALIAASDGSVWIRRSTSAGASSLFDVISPSGEHVARISLASTGRIVAVTERFIYSAFADAEGLEWVERNAFSLSAAR